MSWSAKTVAFIIGVIVVIAGYDVLAVWKGGLDATISWTIFSNSQKYPAIPFLLGYLCGHLTWSQKP